MPRPLHVIETCVSMFLYVSNAPTSQHVLDPQQGKVYIPSLFVLLYMTVNVQKQLNNLHYLKGVPPLRQFPFSMPIDRNS